MKPEHKALIEASFSVIKDESLPVPTEIKIRFSVAGTIKRRGVCYINHTTGKYKIVVPDSKARFYESPTGRYINKEGKRVEKDLVGIELPFWDIMKTMAHEIAHLKFWQHNQEHKGYTNHILQLIINKLGGKYDSERRTFCG